MEGYFSTGQSPQCAVVSMEEEKEEEEEEDCMLFSIHLISSRLVEIFS